MTFNSLGALLFTHFLLGALIAAVALAFCGEEITLIRAGVVGVLSVGVGLIDHALQRRGEQP